MTETSLPTPPAAMPEPQRRPLLRGVFHLAAVPLAAWCGLLLVRGAPEGRAIAAASFASAVAWLFLASGLYHRVAWRPGLRGLMRRVDHAAIFLLIGGTYTAYAIVVLDGAWRWAILLLVWGGVATAILLRSIWLTAPGWVTVGIAIGLGWISVLMLPQLVGAVGLAGVGLLALGGLLFTVGGLVYGRQRPDPAPTIFGFHEIFHLLVIAAIACHYASVAFFLLPAA